MRKVIFDIGMHVGQDTDFYLAKGFRVVAVEADPVLASAAATRFSHAIAAGRLTVLNVGIAETRGQMPFFVNREVSEWSSFDQAIASRGFPVSEIIVDTITIDDLVKRCGVPYYAKIDIEADTHRCVCGFLRQTVKPSFLSYENPKPEPFELLVQAGYTRFKIINQFKVPEYKCPVPAREGEQIDYEFQPGSSGPFGEETPGEWMMIEQCRGIIEEVERRRVADLEAGKPDWFDMHAGLPNSRPIARLRQWLRPRRRINVLFGREIFRPRR
jgi:FkbM family methyltransferase